MNDLELDVVSAHADYTPNKLDYEIAVQVINATFNDYSVIISVGADESAFLWWTDGINEWIEHFERLSHAIARFAHLQICAESAWEKGFGSHPRYFATQFETFINNDRI